MTTSPEGALATLVASCLDALGITQAEVARRMGIPHSSLSSLIKRPKRRLPIDTVSKLAAALEIHTAEVVAAYLQDAGEPADQFALDGPESAIVVGAMRRMDPAHKTMLARIARDFLADEK